jgi:hypothetical protein
MMENLNASDCEKTFEKFSDNTKKVIKDFLQYYMESTFTQYRPAIISMIYYLGINNIENFTYDDHNKTYEIWEIKSEHNTTSNAGRYKFIQYIFAFDIINNKSVFTWDKSRMLFEILVSEWRYQNFTQVHSQAALIVKYASLG